MIQLLRLDAITTTGSDGSATGSYTTPGPVTGKVLGVHIDYSTAQAATTDVTIATVHAPVTTILTVTDNKTDGWYYPRHQVHDSTGTALTLDGTRIMVEPVAIEDQVTVSVAQADNTETVTVSLVIEV